MERTLRIIVFILALAFLLYVPYRIGYRIGKDNIKTTIVPKVETIIVRDTITIEKPIAVTNRVIDSIYVSCYVPEWVHDTIYVALPREEKTYKDSTYMAVVSGYKPSLDRIEVYPTTKIINTTDFIETRRRLGFSIGVGPAFIYSPIYKHLDAGVGVFGGFTYTF